MKTSTVILFLALMSSIGCTTKARPLVVAYGRSMDQHDDLELRVARYRVFGTQRGTLATNVVEVVFRRPPQLPSERTVAECVSSAVRLPSGSVTCTVQFPVPYKHVSGKRTLVMERFFGGRIDKLADPAIKKRTAAIKNLAKLVKRSGRGSR